MNVLFDRQQDLIRIDRFDQVVGNFRADRLVHDVLLLAFGDHNDRGHRPDLLDARQGFETGQTGHHFVEDDQIVLFRSSQIDRIVPVVAGLDVVPFPLKEQNVGLEEVDLVVDP